MSIINYSKCSKEECWEYLEQLESSLVPYNLTERKYKSVMDERHRIKLMLARYDKLRLHNITAEIKYEKLIERYTKYLKAEQEYEAAMLAFDIDRLRQKYSGLIEEKYWEIIGFMLLDYYEGKVTTFEQAIARHKNKLSIKQTKLS